LRGTQSQLHFLRVRHTDFIFSVLAEEMGFLGSLLLLSLYAILITRLVRIATTTSDRYGRLVVVGVTCMLFVQTVVNVGFNVNILPVTGLPLPLVSYGGSSIVTMMLALGLTQSVAMRSKPIENDLLS
jgi:rod shape determining protein RodA